MTGSDGSVFDTTRFLATVGDGHSISTFTEGDLIFSQGERADEIHFVESGHVKISIVSAQGKEAIIGVCSAGHFFGEAVLSGQTIRLATAIAASECRVASVAKATMAATLHDHPSFSEFFIVHLLTRNNRIEADLVDQLFNSSEKRLARILLLLTNFAKEDRTETILPGITQEALAAMVGTTRSRISHFMNKFRDLGFIEYNGKLHVNASLLNVVLND